MKAFTSLIAAAVALPSLVQAFPVHHQCGGLNWTGDTTCEPGTTCVAVNKYFSQCLPDSLAKRATTTTTTTKTSTTKTSTTKTSTTKTSTTKTSTTKTSTTKTSTTATSTSTSKSSTTTLGASTTTSTGSLPSGTSAADLVGFATLNGGTTGGAGGTVTTVGDLVALRAAVAGTEPKIVYVDAMITGDLEVVDVGSNTSIFGICGGGITNGGFRVKNSSNVIFRNLILHHSPAPTDLIAVQVSNNVWIDHNTFYSTKGSDKDEYDGAIDITHAGDYVTVSWNYVHDHWKTSLVGHSDSNSAEDTGKLHVSYHHNYYYNVGSRLPSLRFGTGHVWNNYIDTVSESCVNSRDGAQMLVENNVFVNAAQPLLTTSYGGFAVESGNDWGGAVPELNPGTLTTAPYAYTLEDTATVKDSVVAGAGACKITV